MNLWIDEARQIAAQCWCEEATSGKTMDPELAEAVAQKLATWMDTAAEYARDADFYRGLLDQCAQHLGPEAYTADDGTVGPEPIRLKVPGLVAACIRARDHQPRP